MRKLKLDLNALEVTTFETDEAAGGIGTVMGRVDHAYDTKAACPPETDTCYHPETCAQGCLATTTTLEFTALTMCNCLTDA